MGTRKQEQGEEWLEMNEPHTPKYRLCRCPRDYSGYCLWYPKLLGRGVEKPQEHRPPTCVGLKTGQAKQNNHSEHASATEWSRKGPLTSPAPTPSLLRRKEVFNDVPKYHCGGGSWVPTPWIPPHMASSAFANKDQRALGGFLIS